MGIGFDEASGLALLRAAGEGVAPLRLATGLPPYCTPLRVVGYWEGWEGGVVLSDMVGVVEDCANAQPPPRDRPPVEPSSPWGSSNDEEMGEIDIPLYFFPGTASTALAEAYIVEEVSYLLLHRSDEMDEVINGSGRWKNAPLINETGEVVGVRPHGAYYEALAASAVLDALDRIRAAAEDD